MKYTGHIKEEIKERENSIKYHEEKIAVEKMIIEDLKKRLK
jgi:hypothetical protein